MCVCRAVVVIDRFYMALFSTQSRLAMLLLRVILSEQVVFIACFEYPPKWSTYCTLVDIQSFEVEHSLAAKADALALSCWRASEEKVWFLLGCWLCLQPVSFRPFELCFWFGEMRQKWC